MRLLTFFLLFHLSVLAQTDSILKKNVLVIPYQPMMHLSDADHDISEESQMDPGKMRATLRDGLVKALNKESHEVFNFQNSQRTFVGNGMSDDELVYHSITYSHDSIYPLRFPEVFQKKDSIPAGNIKRPFSEKKYINGVIMDRNLLKDLSRQYNTDYFIILNELDIKTHSDDCINLALKIYRRDLMVHYSIYNSTGKQVYGDVAVSYFASNSNNVDEIMEKNFPTITGQIVKSLKNASLHSVK